MQASALLLRWGSYRRARNLRVLIVYLFFLPVMLPSVLPKLGTDWAVRRISWCLETSLFLRFPSQDGTPSLPLLSLYFVFNIFSYLLFLAGVWGFPGGSDGKESCNDNPVCETAKETQMYRTVFGLCGRGIGWDD